MFKFIISTLFPATCVLCRKDGSYLCESCESELEKNTKIISSDGQSFAKYNYNNKKIKKLLFKIKYYNNPNLAVALGEHCRDFVLSHIESFDDFILVPVPISEPRLRKRSYNQAEKISLGLSQEKTQNILTRSKDTHKLNSTTSIDSRKNEMQNSMSVDYDVLNNLELYYKNKNGLEIKNLKVMTIDDITTSGATYYEARRALVTAGFDSKNIYFFALAH